MTGLDLQGLEQSSEELGMLREALAPEKMEQGEPAGAHQPRDKQVLLVPRPGLLEIRHGAGSAEISLWPLEPLESLSRRFTFKI